MSALMTILAVGFGTIFFSICLSIAIVIVTSVDRIMQELIKNNWRRDE